MKKKQSIDELIGAAILPIIELKEGDLARLIDKFAEHRMNGSRLSFREIWERVKKQRGKK